MKRLLYTLFIILAIFTTRCTYNQDMNRERQPADTIYTAKAAMDVYDYNPERALLILDSAEIVGNLSHDRASYYRAKVLTMTFELKPSHYENFTLQDGYSPGLRTGVCRRVRFIY